MWGKIFKEVQSASDQRKKYKNYTLFEVTDKYNHETKYGHKCYFFSVSDNYD